MTLSTLFIIASVLFIFFISTEAFIAFMLTIITLKFCGLINISWLKILSPIIGFIGFLLTTSLSGIIFFILKDKYEERQSLLNKRKKEKEHSEILKQFDEIFNKKNIS